jgi:hypothetical protein
MKKLGTPIAAGPGSDSENVGFDGPGTPLPLGSFAAAFFWAWLPDCACDFFFFFFLCFFLCLCFLCALAAVEDCCSDWLGFVCLGVVDVELLVVVVLELEVELELELELEVEVELEELDEVEELEGLVVVVLLEDGLVVVLELVVIVTVGAVVVLDELDWQDSLSDATAPLIGRFIDEIGVPGGTLTLNVSVCPVTRVTVTVHASADATGRLATSDSRIAPARASTSESFRLPSNVARFLPFPVCLKHV